MNRYSLSRYILIFVLLLLGVLYALPNLYGEVPAIQISNASGTALSTGTLSTIKQELMRLKIKDAQYEAGEHALSIRFQDVEDQLKAQDSLKGALGRTYSVALNLASQTPAWLEAIGAEPMRLGLDLRGGIHFLMYLDLDKALHSHIKGDYRAMTSLLRVRRIRYQGTSMQGALLSFRFSDEAVALSAQKKLQLGFPAYKYVIKSPVSSGGYYDLSASLTPAAKQDFETKGMQQTITVLRNRVNAVGVSEPIVQQQGKNYISVDLPGMQNAARAKKLIGATATVQMQLVDTESNVALAKQTGIVPFGTDLLENRGGVPYLLKDEILLGGSSITNARAGFQNGSPEVSITASGPQVSHFTDVTGKNVNKPMAVVYIETKSDVTKQDGKTVVKTYQVSTIINVATIQQALANSFVINGMPSMQAAQNLALLLRSGAYPIAPTIVEEQVIGPSMGKQNIEKGEYSVAFGLLLVVVFMLAYYRFFGLVADLALLVNLIFILAIMSVLHATLTLPGIAGIVLTIGMAVDANVLINERIREELRLGMTPQAAINAGYGRAFSTIVDANVTTLIVAVVLYGIGSGPVKNFAITLIIGLLTSMLSAIFFTRAVVNLHYGYRRTLKRISIGIRCKNDKGSL